MNAWASRHVALIHHGARGVPLQTEPLQTPSNPGCAEVALDGVAEVALEGS